MAAKAGRVRLLVVLLAVVVTGGLLAGGAAEPEAPEREVPDEFEWRQFEGETVVFNFPSHAAYNAVAPLIPEFEELTGITVETDQMAYMRLHDAQLLEMSQPQGDYDLIAMGVMWKTEYADGGLIQPLQPFFDQQHLAMPDYDFDDLVAPYVENTGMVGGDKIYLGGEGAELYGIPLGAETSFLAYRKDLFEEHGVDVPQTYDEVVEVARFFAEEVDGVYGLAMRGASGHQATHSWLMHASPFGATVFDENWEPAFTSPESIETLEFMKKMVEYGPPGTESFDQDGQFNAFLQGETAMYIDASVITGPIRDPELSAITGKVGYARHPEARTGLSQTGGFGIAIPSNARNPEAAFLLMQWLTSPEIERRAVLDGAPPVRHSTVDDPEMQEQFPEFEVLAEQLEYANPDWRPIIPEWGEINEQLGIAINQVLTGDKTPEQAMQDVEQPIRDIMERAGYYD